MFSDWSCSDHKKICLSADEKLDDKLYIVLPYELSKVS